MIYRTLLSILSLLICSTTFAAHIVTETRSNGILTHRTDTYANAAGDLRMDERSYGYSSTISSSAAVGSPTETQTHLSENIDDTTLYQSNKQAIVSLEGNIRRTLTADSEPPIGLGVPGMDLGESRKQMAGAMGKAGKAFADAMKQAENEGMTAEQRRALESFTKPFMDVPDVKPRDTLEVSALNSRTTVGKYSAEGYLVSDLDGNEKHRIWVVPTNSVAGGAHVRNAMQGMMDTYAEYLGQMGGEALMDTGLVSMFSKAELADKYPVRIEDLDTGEVTDIVEAHNSGPAVDYYPDCVQKDMFGY